MCEHYRFVLTEEYRHYINSAEDNFCVLCLVNRKGAMTQEEVGKYLGLTKMRISQIENYLVKKLQKLTKHFQN